MKDALRIKLARKRAARKIAEEIVGRMSWVRLTQMPTREKTVEWLMEAYRRGAEAGRRRERREECKYRRVSGD